METAHGRPARRSVLNGFRHTLGDVFWVSDRRTPRGVAESAPVVPDPTGINTERLWASGLEISKSMSPERTPARSVSLIAGRRLRSTRTHGGGDNRRCVR